MNESADFDQPSHSNQRAVAQSAVYILICYNKYRQFSSKCILNCPSSAQSKVDNNGCAVAKMMPYTSL